MALLSLGLGIYGLFHGYFDRGHFEIKQLRWSSSKQVGIVAERSDQEALSSYTCFVLIEDHLLSSGELRAAYYSNTVVFAASSSCLNLRWEDSNKLVIVCFRVGSLLHYHNGIASDSAFGCCAGNGDDLLENLRPKVSITHSGVVGGANGCIRH